MLLGFAIRGDKSNLNSSLKILQRFQIFCYDYFQFEKRKFISDAALRTS